MCSTCSRLGFNSVRMRVQVSSLLDNKGCLPSGCRRDSLSSVGLRCQQRRQQKPALNLIHLPLHYVETFPSKDTHNQATVA